MQLNLTIDLKAVLIGFVLLLVAAGIATPFAISLADDGPAPERSSAQPISLGTAFTYQGQLNNNGSLRTAPMTSSSGCSMTRAASHRLREPRRCHEAPPSPTALSQ